MTLKRKFFRIFLALIVLGLVFYACLIIKIYGYTNIDNAQNADAIVVMGASQWNGSPSPVFKNRLDHAFSLRKQGFSQNFILTGGVGGGDKISESQVGKDYLMEKDIDRNQVFIEENGRTSLQSLTEVKRILKEQNFNSIILVSDGFHMLRLNKMLKDLKINAYLSAVPEKFLSKLSEFKYVLRESRVYLLYFLFKI